MITANTPVEVPTHLQYSRSFASYEIPFRPDDLVEFADTEGLKSFYVAYRDAAGRIIKFDKVRLVRVEKKPREFDLPALESPGASIYFEVLRDPTTGEPAVGAQVDYTKTEHLGEFFAGQVDSSGHTCHAVLFRKEIAFSDSYEYWPNGRLRLMTGPDQPPAVTHYDHEGSQVILPVPELKAGAEIPT
jgi:hypothetical protein